MNATRETTRPSAMVDYFARKETPPEVTSPIRNDVLRIAKRIEQADSLEALCGQILATLTIPANLPHAVGHEGLQRLVSQWSDELSSLRRPE